MASIQADIYSRSTAPPVGWIPIINQKSPALNVTLSEEYARQLLQLGSIFIYLADTDILLTGHNWYDYFPGSGGGGGGGGGEGYSKAEVDQKIAAVNRRIQDLNSNKANKSDVYTKQQIDDGWYNKDDIDELIGHGGGGAAVWSKDVTASETIGMVTPGKKYLKDSPLEVALEDVISKYTKPGVTLAITPSTTLYDAVSGSIDSIKLTAVVKKNTDPITVVTFKIGSNTVQTITNNVANGGTFTFTYTPSTPIKTNTSFTATATDGKQTATSTINVVFIGRSYYGTMGSDVSQPTAAQIQALNTTLKNSKGYSYQHINMTYGKVVYAYPKSLGALTSIKDPVNNINYTDTFARTEVTIDGIAYYCYTQIDPSAATDVRIDFA